MRRALASALVALLMAACGGGGGDDEEETPVDNRPPQCVRNPALCA